MKREEAILQKEQSNGETLHISREKLVLLVSNMFGGTDENPNPDEPLKPGPWDPVIRKVAKQVLGPSPEPWRSEFYTDRLILGIIAARYPEIYDVIGGGRFDLAALNPQPLPPRAKLLVSITQEVIDRILLIQETADTINQAGEQQGIIIVGGRISQFVSDIDELCPRLPRKFPKPKGGEDRFTAVELLAAGAVFEQNAATIEDGRLQQELRNAGAKLIETGIARM